jgi:thiol-disulfide isomerase/thioredoxin
MAAAAGAAGPSAVGEDGDRMTKGKTILLMLLLAVVALILTRWLREGGGSREGAAVGRHAPAFQLKDLEGHDVALAQFKGKVVMLDFWATWCGPCRLTMPMLEELQHEHPDAFTLLAVNLGEPPDLVTPYVRRQNIQSRVLLDIDGRVGSAYGSESIPMQVLIDQEGIIRHIQMGYYPTMKDDLWAEIAKLQNY